MNKIIYIHKSTLLRLREIKSQNNLISDDEVVQHLIMHHNYLCLVERVASRAESEPWSNGELLPGSATGNASGIETQCDDSQLASGRISVPCSSDCVVTSGETGSSIEALSTTK